MSETNDSFYYPIQVRYADTDAQGHVFFGNYLTYFDEACSAYFRAMDYPWQKLNKDGLDIYYVDARCSYKGSAVFEDVLHVYARVSRIGNSSLTIECAAHKSDSGVCIASGSLTAVVVDPETRQPVRVPDSMRQAIAAFDSL